MNLTIARTPLYMRTYLTVAPVGVQVKELAPCYGYHLVIKRLPFASEWPEAAVSLSRGVEAATVVTH